MHSRQSTVRSSQSVRSSLVILRCDLLSAVRSSLVSLRCGPLSAVRSSRQSPVRSSLGSAVLSRQSPVRSSLGSAVLSAVSSAVLSRQSPVRSLSSVSVAVLSRQSPARASLVSLRCGPLSSVSGAGLSRQSPVRSLSSVSGAVPSRQSPVRASLVSLRFVILRCGPLSAVSSAVLSRYSPVRSSLGSAVLSRQSPVRSSLGSAVLSAVSSAVLSRPSPVWFSLVSLGMAESEAAAASRRESPDRKIVCLRRSPEKDELEDDPALLVFYFSSREVHDALRLQGTPVRQEAQQVESLRAFERHVHRVIAGGMETPKNLVENVSQTRVEGATSYFRNVYHRLSRKSYLAAVQRLKEEFPPSDPWVQALPGPLGVVMEVRGGTGFGAVEVCDYFLRHDTVVGQTRDDRIGH